MHHPLLEIWNETITDDILLDSQTLRAAVEVMAQTFTAGTLSNGERANYISEFLAYVDLIFYHSRQKNTARINAIDMALNKEVSPYTYAKLAAIACNRRRIFKTKTGSYGIGPACMRKGDIVVVLYGGHTPYILRPWDNRYLFLGQAYVHRIMDGKLVHDMRAGKIQEKVFCLM